MRYMRVVCSLATLILTLSTLHAGTIHVPVDYATVQDAINAAVHGDTVVVDPGTYHERLNFLGKAITVTSAQGPEVTIIDADQGGSVVTFAAGEGLASVFSGFTVQHGRASSEGGGIVIANASPTISRNVIRNNGACAGAGIAIGFGSPTIRDNQITNNAQAGCSGGTGGGGLLIRGTSAAQILDNVIADNVMTSANGGGISLFAAGAPIIQGNRIRGNTATGLSPCAQGGGLSLVNVSNALIVQNVITGNTAGCGGGIFWLVPSGARGPLLVNNTIADNPSALGSGLFADGFDAQTELINNIIVASVGHTAVYCGNFNDAHPPRFTFNDVWSPSGAAYGGICGNQSGLNGNLSADPLFVDPAAGDYHLERGSPAIDAGDNLAPALPATDMDGDLRLLDGEGSGEAVIDLGADEFASDVVIQRAEFLNNRSQLVVSAISTAAPNVELFVTVPTCLQEARMSRTGDTYVYREKVPACGNLDGQIATVTSSVGGVDMATIR